MAGYSWTLPAVTASPNVSLTAMHWRLVLTRLNGRVRIAGLADIQPSPETAIHRANQLKLMAKELAPAAGKQIADQICTR